MGLQRSVLHEEFRTLGAHDVLTQCQRAKVLEEAGEFDKAREELAPFWVTVGERPATGGLTDWAKAELLLRAGTLTGWIGSARQLQGAQEMAKDLVSESASLFETLGLVEKAAEAKVDLGICYWREGAIDEARITLRLALESLGELESEQRLRALLNSAIVEQVAFRYEEALKIYRDAAPFFERSTNDSLKGKFHNSYAIVLKGLGLSQDREDYIDHALLEFAAARFHFEQAGHKRFRARVENNEGFLFAGLGRFREAYEHIDRARLLHQSVGDNAGVAGADDTRAQTLLLEGKYELAEKIARGAVRSLKEGEEHSILAEALTTHGKALARLQRQEESQSTLDHALAVARRAGDPESGGLAALTIIEELDSYLKLEALADYYRTAESLLSNTQNRRVRKRLGECARRLLAFHFAEAERELTQEPAADEATTRLLLNAEASDSAYSLEAEVHRYEGSLIRQALEASGGSVTRAARLLGVTHQGLAFILNGRHSDLLSIRTPVKRRRRSIIRYH
ncbi:MAG TPA: helix-turn-helix domain-containing protein [Pyrinomonadaceae bacterium]|nr:helix-turn-helix domain-containing protein [Pyrinomonadaceae bacterium]